MKRSLRIAAGIAVLLAMVFGSGYLFKDSSALAAGGDGSSEHKILAGILKSAPPADFGEISKGKPLPSGGNPSMAKNDISIKSNTTVGSKTYSGNVDVYPGITVTVGSNAKITVNGDLTITGTLKMSSGTLTVNGDIWVFGSMSLSGTAKVIVNKAASGGVSGEYGGGLVASDYFGYGGMLTVGGSANVTINYAQAGGLFVQDTGLLVMNSPSAKITVNNRCFFAGRSTAGKLTAGTLEIINGHFYQDGGVDDASFSPSAAFRVTMRSTNTSKYIVYFETPRSSYFTSCSFTSINFDGIDSGNDSQWSLISINVSLSADTALNCKNAVVYLLGDLKGKKLTITAAEVDPGIPLTIGSGSLAVNGDFYTGAVNNLTMDNPAGKLIVNGTYYSVNNSNLTAGRLEINGNFKQTDPFKIDAHFAPGPNFITKISGPNRLLTFESPVSSYFTKFELGTGTTLNSGSNVSIRCDLTADATMKYPALTYRGKLNGHTLTSGSMYIPTGGAVDLGGGNLNVQGNLDVRGALTTNSANDVVRVSGNFTVQEGAIALTAGKLYLAGNLSCGPGSFQASGSHITVLSGTGAQTISFGGDDSYFNTLVVDLPNKDIVTNCAQKIVSGTSLASLTASVGTLSPAYGNGTSSYKLLLPAGTDAVTITPALPAEYSTSSWFTQGSGTNHITQVDVTNVPYDGKTTANLIVHAYGDVAARAITIDVMTINPDLGSLNLPAGAYLDQPFDPNTTAYTAQLPATAASFAWSPLPDNAASAVSIDGGGNSATVALTPGQSKNYNVRVTAQDGTTKKNYTVTFTRRNPVASITVAGGTLSPAFNAGVKDYTVTIPASTSVTISATAGADIFNGSLKINGIAQNSVILSPAPGASATATIEAKDADGKSTTTYVVTVNSVNMLSGITVAGGALTPAFAPNVFAYSVYVANTVSSVAVTPVKTSGVTIKINGSSTTSAVLKPGTGGSATATIVCTYGAVSQTYTVTVYRIAPITGITITGGTLSPAFSPATSSYKVSVPATTSSVKVTPVKASSCQSLLIDGKSVSYVTLKPPVGGKAVTTVKATARNGKVFTYTITVTRAALITGITTSPGKLSPAFNATVLAYTVTVPATTTQVKITPVKAKTGVKSITINGKSARYATIKPPVGGSAVATIVATASDGKTKVTYKVTVKRNPLLTKINLSSGCTLTPVFAGNVFSYKATLPATTSSVKITPVKGTNVKTITIGGSKAPSRTYSVPLGGSITVPIVVTATDKKSKSTYTIKLVRPAPLTGIKVGGTAISFSAAKAAYDVNVPATASSVAIAPTLAASCKYSVNGGALNSPVTLTPAPGGAATATIVATAPDGKTMTTYKVVVHRAPALAGLSASNATGELTLSPAFSAGVLNYTVHVTASDPAKTVAIAASPDGSTTAAIDKPTVDKPAEGNSVDVRITASGANGLKTVYTVTVIWDPQTP